MARTRFYYHEKGNHDETWHYLCEEDGAFHVETETSPGPGRDWGSTEGGKPSRRSIDEFLRESSGSVEARALQEAGLREPTAGSRTLQMRRSTAHPHRLSQGSIFKYQIAG